MGLGRVQGSLMTPLLSTNQCCGMTQAGKRCSRKKVVGDEEFCKTHRRMYEEYLNSEQALLDYWDGMADAASY